MASTTVAIKPEIRNNNLRITTPIVVSDGVQVYQGALVCIDGSGEGIDGVNTASMAGIAEESVLGDGTVKVVCNSNYEVRFPMSGAAATDVGTTAYAADNQTATTTTKTCILGRITDWETGYVWVHLTGETVD